MDLREGHIQPVFASEPQGGRGIACTLLADTCATFVLLHEIGHLVSGHVGAARLYFQEDRFCEFFSLETTLFRGRFLRRLWEYGRG